MKPITLAFVVISLTLNACSSSKPVAPAAEKKIVMNMMKSKNELMAKGIPAAFVTTTSKDLQMAMNMAEMEARAQITRSLESKVGTMQKEFAEQAADEVTKHYEEVTKSVSSRVLSGTTLSKVDYDETAGGFRVYGLMVLDPRIFKETLELELKSQEAAKTRYLASKGYKELDKEIQAFDSFKSNDRE